MPQVALAVALAHCDEAAAAMDHGDGAALGQAVQHMQQAVDLLHRHKTGASLQQEISQALQVGDGGCSASGLCLACRSHRLARPLAPGRWGCSVPNRLADRPLNMCCPTGMPAGWRHQACMNPIGAWHLQGHGCVTWQELWVHPT